MKKEVMIGQLVSRKRIMIEAILSIPGIYFFAVMMINQIVSFPFLKDNASIRNDVRIFILSMFTIIIIIASASYGDRQVIVVDEHYFKYCSSQGLLAKYQQVIRNILQREQVYDIQIPLDDIKEITLSYSNVYMLWNQKGHSIIFNITLKDGSLVSIQPDNLYFKKENCLAGIEFIMKQGVVVCDPYHLIEALKDQTMRFAEYVEMVNKHEH